MFLHMQPSELSQAIGFQYTTLRWILACLSGALLPFGFAPFHQPGLAILGLALFLGQLNYSLNATGKSARKNAFLLGFTFGLGYLGFGVSWVFVSIHNYGHLNIILSALITLLFIAYLSLFTGAVAYCFQLFAAHCSQLMRCFVFSALWCLGEYCRSTLLTGFPWMLLGFGQIDTPLKHLLPIVGVYGVGFIAALAASFLAILSQEKKIKQLPWLFAFIGILIFPVTINTTTWSNTQNNPIPVSVIQANLSMKDKWDESLFLKVLEYYKNKIAELTGDNQLIVMPESAIPAPDSYVSDYLNTLHEKSRSANTAILLGIPEEPSRDTYYNSLIALGVASGTYQKKHLVPFGEFIPKPFQQIINWLSIPIANITKGRHDQALVEVFHHPIATLICYELAYPALLREQLPAAEWIVSISDDGWFGHSFAMYQQLQMAQALSVQTGRYQIVANNDGLSSVIDNQGFISESLKAYQPGILKSHIYPATGATPWVVWGDTPALFFSLIVLVLGLFKQLRFNRMKIHDPVFRS
jgi:apolipoprotein N-acyltransferase